MSNQETLKESLSALLDHEAGAADELELRRLLKACEEDGELLATYERYSLSSQILAGDLRVPQGFYRRVSEAIDTADNDVDAGDMVLPAKRHGAAKPTRRLAKQMALAASVAVLSVVTVQWQRSASPTPVSSASLGGAQTVSSLALQNSPSSVAASQGSSHTIARTLPQQVVSVSAGESLALLPEAGDSVQSRKAQLLQRRRQQMQAYLMQHLEQASLNDSRGMMPFARVSYLNDAENR